MSAAAVALAPLAPIPFAELAPILRPVLARMLERVSLPARARILEAGSAAGLLTALLAESPLAASIAAADLADPSPVTLEAATTRAAHWPWRVHFINSSIHQLAPRPVYPLILAWDIAPAALETLAAHQLPPGHILHFHQKLEEDAHAAYALHHYRRIHAETYRLPAGRHVRAATLWSSTR